MELDQQLPPSIKDAKEETIEIEFNTFVAMMKYDAKVKNFVPLAASFDACHELGKLLEEVGDTAEETAVLKRLHTRTFSISQAQDYIEKKQAKIFGVSSLFYTAGQKVKLPKKDASYYLEHNCGGEPMLPDENTYKTKQMVRGYYKENIDGKAMSYKASEIARFNREHRVIPLAKLVA